MDELVSQFDCMLDRSNDNDHEPTLAPIISGSITDSAPCILCDNPIVKPYQAQVLCQLIAHENLDSFELPSPYNRMYNTHTILSMPAGSGKTITALQLCTFTQYPTHIDTSSSFEFFAQSGPNGSMGVTIMSNSETLPNRDATLIIVPPHMLNHWVECAHTVMKWTIGKEYAVEKFGSVRTTSSTATSKRRKTNAAANTLNVPCIIVCATRASLQGACNFMWRRCIIDEPELVSKALPAPMAYHTFIMTASTDELFLKKNCCMAPIFQHLRDFEKKTSCAMLDRTVVHLDRDYYQRYLLFKSHTKIHTVPGQKVLTTLVCDMPNGMTTEATMAANMSDYNSLAQIVKLNTDNQDPVETIDDLCDAIEMCAQRTISSMSVLSTSQQSEFMVKVCAIRNAIEQMKSERDLGGHAKVAMLLKILCESTGKSLIICRYGIPLIVQALSDNDIEFADLTCPMKPDDLASTLDSVKTGSSGVKVILLNPRYYARGLDIQFVENLFVMHSIGQSVATQWLGRAIRQNRTCDLNVAFLLTDCEPSMFS